MRAVQGLRIANRRGPPAFAPMTLLAVLFILLREELHHRLLVGENGRAGPVNENHATLLKERSKPLRLVLAQSWCTCQIKTQNLDIRSVLQTKYGELADTK